MSSHDFSSLVYYSSIARANSTWVVHVSYLLTAVATVSIELSSDCIVELLTILCTCFD